MYLVCPLCARNRPRTSKVLVYMIGFTTLMILYDWSVWFLRASIPACSRCSIACPPLLSSVTYIPIATVTSYTAQSLTSDCEIGMLSQNLAFAIFFLPPHAAKPCKARIPTPAPDHVHRRQSAQCHHAFVFTEPLATGKDSDSYSIDF